MSTAYRRAKDLMQTNMQLLEDITQALLDKEVLDQEEFEQIVAASGAPQYLKPDAPEIEVPFR